MADRDAKEFVLNIVEWGTPQLRDYAEMWIEEDENVRMIPPHAVSSAAFRQQYPHLQNSGASRNMPFLKDGESYALSNIMAANLYTRTLADDEFVRVVGGAGDEEAVVTQTRAIKRTFHQPQHQHVMYRAFMDAATYGLGWIENPVETLYDMSIGPSQRRLGPASPFTRRDFAPRLTSRREPVWRNWSVFDVIPDWTCPLGAPMKFAVGVGRMGADDFKTFITASKGDPDRLERALKRNNKEYHFGEKMGERWRQLAIRGLTEADLQLPEAFRPVQYWMFRGEDPSFPVGSTERYRLIIVANDEAVLDVPAPYYPHTFRIIQMPPFNGRPFGMSPVEVARYEQDELDTFRMLRAKAAIRTVRTPILYDPGALDDATQLEEPDSDQVIGVRGDISRSIGQMQFNYAPIFTSMQLINEERNYIRESTGLVDLVRGIAAGSRTTAREIGELSVLGNLPLDVRVDLIENEDLPALARDIPQRFLLALRDERDPDAALRDRLGADNARMEHLVADASIIFQGSARFRARSGFGGIVQNLVTLLATVPGLASFINMPRLVTDLVSLGSPDAVERYMLDPSSAIGQAIAMQTLAGGAAQRGAASPPRATAAAG